MLDPDVVNTSIQKRRTPMPEEKSNDAVPKIRTGQGSSELPRKEWERRFRMRFYDPAFEVAQPEIDRLADIAWEAYQDDRKSPRTCKAGAEFADPRA